MAKFSKTAHQNYRTRPPVEHDEIRNERILCNASMHMLAGTNLANRLIVRKVIK